MLKKIFLSLIFIFLFSNIVLADTEYVTALEKKLFGVNYPNDSYSKRVDRIEKEIYGKNYIGNSEERLEKIYKIYSKEEILGLNNVNEYKTSDINNEDFEYKNSEYNEYPIITLIEEKLYGKIQSELSLNERVEKLKKQTQLSNKPNNSQSSYYSHSDNYSVYNNNSRISNILQEMELETFSHSYPDNTDNDRIKRLEKFYFGAYQDSLSEKQRLTKLVKVISKNTNYSNDYSEMTRLERNAQWAELIMNLLIIGLGLIL